MKKNPIELFLQWRLLRAHTAIKCRGHSLKDAAILALGLAPLLALTSLSLAAEQQLLHGHVPEAIVNLKLQPVDRLPATNQLHLAIGLPLRNTNELSQLMQDLYDPASVRFRHYLTPEQFTEKFGPSKADYGAVIAFAKDNGLDVTGTQPNRMFLNVSGSAAKIERTMRIKMLVFQHPTEARTFFAPDTEPSLDLAVPVLFIGGLNNLDMPKPLSHKIDPLALKVSGANAFSGSGPSGSYIGNDFRAAYAPGVTLDGSGQVLGLLQAAGYFAKDIAAYEAKAGLPNVPLTNVLIDGFNGAAFPNDNNSEAALDIEMAISMAPGLSQIIVYEGPAFSDFAANDFPVEMEDILNRMATDNLARQLSSSYGQHGFDPIKTQIYQEFALQGQSFFQASGDAGAYNSTICYEGEDPNETSVGGTTLLTSGPGGSWMSEKVWNWWSTSQGANAGGGGISITNFSIPAYQQPVNMSSNNASTALRNSPDVALTADNVYVVADNGQSENLGGTSCAAPLWAAFTALINQQAAQMGSNSVGFLNPALYAIGLSSNYTACFHDITSGNNTNPSSPNHFYAQPGYDLCTGWGTPRGSALINLLAPLDTLVIIPSSGFSSANYAGGNFKNVNQTFQLTNSGSASLNWAIGTTSAWLDVSSLAGTLAPGTNAAVIISTNDAAANLGAGSYISTVWFTNLSDGVVQSRRFSLQVNDDLQITPTGPLSFLGTMVGGFQGGNQSLVLTNAGVQTLNWAVANTSALLGVIPSSGAISPAASMPVTVSVLPSAASLGLGSYTNTLWFTNLNDGAVQARTVMLSVWPWIINGGFDTGDFTGWTVSSIQPNNGSLEVVNMSNYVHSGSSGAALGASGSLGSIYQYVPTWPGGKYLLSLWLHSPDGQTPNQFQVLWNGTLLYSANNLPAGPWTNLQFAVSAVSSRALLMIRGRDDPSALAMDDISLVSTTPPALQNVTASGNAVTVSWSAQVGLSYQAQYATRLDPPDWTNLGGAITATNATMKLSDPTAPSGSDMRFYHILLVP
jgi:hypothetical protein